MTTPQMQRPKTTKTQPLSSDQAREGIEREERAMEAALAAGDQAAWTEAHRRREFFSASLEAATEREIQERLAARRAELEAKRPAAREAIKAALLETALEGEMADVRRAVELLASVHARIHKRLPEIIEAGRTAAKLAREADLPVTLPRPTTSQIRELLGPVVLRALHDARLSGEPVIPTVSVTPIVIVGAA